MSIGYELSQQCYFAWILGNPIIVVLKIGQLRVFQFVRMVAPTSSPDFDRIRGKKLTDPDICKFSSTSIDKSS